MMEKVWRNFISLLVSFRNSLCGFGKEKDEKFRVGFFDAMRRQAVKGRDDDDD